MKASEVISAALGILADESDWCQHDLQKYSSLHHKMQYCLVGSLQQVGGFNDFAFNDNVKAYHAVRMAISRVLAEQYSVCDGAIGRWNDTHTFAEVRSVLEKSRANLEEIGQ